MTTERNYWNRFPQLETQRLVLREITLPDTQDIYAIYSDADVMRYWGALPHHSADETRIMIEGIRASYLTQQGIRWGITFKSSNMLIGSCGHWRLIKSHFRSEIGYELAKAYWGQGIMAEAVEAIVQFGFQAMGLHSIEAQVEPANIRSARLLEKVRFRQEGYQRENFYYAGRFYDTLLYARLCTD